MDMVDRAELIPSSYGTLAIFVESDIILTDCLVVVVTHMPIICIAIMTEQNCRVYQRLHEILIFLIAEIITFCHRVKIMRVTIEVGMVHQLPKVECYFTVTKRVDLFGRVVRGFDFFPRNLANYKFRCIHFVIGLGKFWRF